MAWSLLYCRGRPSVGTTRDSLSVLSMDSRPVVGPNHWRCLVLKRLLLSLLALIGAGTAQASTILNLDPKTTVVLREVVGQATVDERLKFSALASAGVPEITIVIDSPGGSVFEGLQFIQQIRNAQANGTEVRCVGTGKVISMAYFIFTACDTRYAMPDSIMLFHPIRIFFLGVLTADKAEGIANDIGRL